MRKYNNILVFYPALYVYIVYHTGIIDYWTKRQINDPSFAVKLKIGFAATESMHTIVDRAHLPFLIFISFMTYISINNLSCTRNVWEGCLVYYKVYLNIVTGHRKPNIQFAVIVDKTSELTIVVTTTRNYTIGFLLHRLTSVAIFPATARNDY